MEPPEIAGVAHRTVRADSLDVHVAEAGSGAPMVLLHGWPQHWWCWRHLIGPLAQSHRVIVPDLRGLGWTSVPAGGYDKPRLAADVVALLDALDVDRVTFVGHDWGAYTGFLLATAHPERVERLIALDITVPWAPRPRPQHLALPLFLSYQAILATPGLGERAAASPRFLRTVIERGSGPDMRWDDADLELYVERFADPARAHAAALIYRTFLTRELGRGGPGPGDLRVPTLLVQGERSALRRIPGAGQRLGPSIRLEVVDRAGHFLPEEAPEAVLALISRA